MNANIFIFFWSTLHWACISLVFVHNLLCFWTNKLSKWSEPYWSSWFLFNPLLPPGFKRVHDVPCSANEWGYTCMFLCPASLRDQRVPSGWERLTLIFPRHSQSCGDKPFIRLLTLAMQRPRPWVSDGPLSYNRLVIVYRHLQTIRMLKFGLRRYQTHSYVKPRGVCLSWAVARYNFHHFFLARLYGNTKGIRMAKGADQRQNLS